ncbi:MAG: formate/nitrite transporter family protein [Pseudomonadota bacterium]
MTDAPADTRHDKMRAPEVYLAISAEGVEEMNRPTASLFWSGVAAGLLIAFSVVAEALLRAHLPATEWRPLVENFGYSAGFLIVIMGRMQLFTENTITTVLPTVAEPSWDNIGCSARIWGIVFGANLVGAAVAALFLAEAGSLAAPVNEAIGAISAHAIEGSGLDIFIRAIPAGILIAAIVWMLPSAETSTFWVVLFFTYLIALGDFAHVVAGSVEAFYVLFTDEAASLSLVLGFLIPAFLGNVVGGTVVFAVLAYGQVREELPDNDESEGPGPH